MYYKVIKNSSNEFYGDNTPSNLYYVPMLKSLFNSTKFLYTDRNNNEIINSVLYNTNFNYTLFQTCLHIKFRDIIKDYLLEINYFNKDNFLYIHYNQMIQNIDFYNDLLNNFLNTHNFDLNETVLNKTFINTQKTHKHHAKLNISISKYSSLSNYNLTSYQENKIKKYNNILNSFFSFFNFRISYYIIIFYLIIENTTRKILSLVK